MKVLLVVYDNNQMLPYFPVGTAYIAAALRKAGHDVAIYSQDVHHYPDSHLTEYLDSHHFDVVGIGVIAGYYQYRRLLKLSEAINASKNRPSCYVLGGHGPSPEPEYFLKITNADVAVIGEGEETIVDLLDAIDTKRSYSEVKGIVFREGNKVTVNQRRPLIQDLDSIAWPAYDLFPMEVYRLTRYPHMNSNEFSMQMLSARGCTFKCNFCYRLDEGYRPRASEPFLDEIRYLNKEYRINYFDFEDELLMSSRQRAVEISEAILQSGLKFKWYCNGRLNYATPDVLKIMRKAGCVYINYGIEAFDNRILKNMNKALTESMIVKGIEATLAAGISPGFNMIFGNIGENAEVLQKDIDFLLKYNDYSEMRTIRPVTPYPGSPLYYQAIQDGQLEGVEDFYKNKHLNSDLLAVNFTAMTDKDYYDALKNANITLIKAYFENQLNRSLEVARNLYDNKDTEFRGFR